MDAPDQSMPNNFLTLFLCGDVMTGRGIDQALPQSVDPRLYEPFVRDARKYLYLAEKENGEIEEPATYKFIWGDALAVWERFDPAIRLINLETGITFHDKPWQNKGIHYRMHPENIKVLTSAGIDFCSLANNHTMDWQHKGLTETLQTLEKANITCAGAGKNLEDAEKPAFMNTGKLLSLKMVPMQIKHFKLSYASPTDVRLSKEIMERECSKFGSTVQLKKEVLELQFQ